MLIILSLVCAAIVLWYMYVRPDPATARKWSVVLWIIIMLSVIQSILDPRRDRRR